MEIIAVLFSLISVWLTSKDKIWCWPTGIIGVISFACLFYTKGEWANVGLQFIFLFQSISAWINWKNPSVKISKIRKDDFVGLVYVLIILGVFVYSFSLIANSTQPLLDSVTTSLSIAGMFLLVHKNIEAWYCWILADILYVILFLKDELYLSSFIYIVFLVMAIYGYKNWKKQIKHGI